MKNDSLKVILIVVLVAVAGFFLYKTMSNRQVGQAGLVGSTTTQKMYIVGSGIMSSIDGITWQTVGQALPNASDHLTSAFGKLFLVGGDFLGVKTQKSTNGATWTETSLPPWTPLPFFSEIKHNNALFMIGGTVLSSSNKSIWRSIDGTNWTKINTNAPFANDVDSDQSNLASFLGKLFVFTGVNSWSSADNGLTWSLVGQYPHQPSETRRRFGVTVLRDALWISGGVNDGGTVMYNDVWKSLDGVTWTQVVNNAPWGQYSGSQPGRAGHCMLSFKNKLWIIRGFNFSANFNDAWSSSDGITWTQTTNILPPGPMIWDSCAVL